MGCFERLFGVTFAIFTGIPLCGCMGCGGWTLFRKVLQLPLILVLIYLVLSSMGEWSVEMREAKCAAHCNLKYNDWCYEIRIWA